jgi:hypothetical protein
MKQRTTTIHVLNETWRVPRGFGAAYRRVLKDHFALIAAGEPGKLISEVVDLLALVGYEATREQVADWDLRKRVEDVIYAATEHARASDNPIPRHSRPSWLPEQPWKGPPTDVSSIRSDLHGAFEGPSGTPIAERARDQDQRRLRDGANALAASSTSPETATEARAQLAIVGEGIAALQSLDDLGAEANAQAERDQQELWTRHAALKKLLKELDAKEFAAAPSRR